MDINYKNYINHYSTDDDFRMEVEYTINRPTKSYYEETKIAAEIIWANKIGPLHLFYSGGKDSEYVLQVFKTLGMDIKPVIISHQYNQHDVKYAFDFCNANNIKPLIIKEDFDKFVNSERFNDVVECYHYGYYHYVNICYWMTQIDGTFLAGSANPHLVKGIDKQWYVFTQESNVALGKFIKKKKLHGTHCFLSYTAEQMLGFINEPVIVDLVNDRIPGKTGSESSKNLIYNNQTDFVIPDRPKYDGYELIEKNEIFNHPNMKLVIPTKNEQMRYCLSEHKEVITSFKTGNKMTRHAGAMKMDTTGYEKFSSYMATILINQYNDIT
jgi:hypothetical protein